MNKAQTFELHEEALYTEKPDQIIVILCSDDSEDDVFVIDQLARQVFLMAINNFSYDHILDVCHKAKIEKHEGKSVKEEVDQALEKFINLKFLIKK